MKRGSNIKEALILQIIALAAVTSCEELKDGGISTTYVPFRKRFPWPDETTPRPTAENGIGCYGELGCINVDDEYRNAFWKPFGGLVLPRETAVTRFFLYTSINQTGVQYLAVGNKSIENSTFDSQKPTKFILHGWQSNHGIGWIKNMTNELVKHRPCNVIVVDWAESCGGLYSQAVVDGMLVALRTAYFIKHLTNNHSVNIDDVHLIGHSLGAHIAGTIGKKLGGRLGRITGLDPAEWIFEQLSSHHRLDPTDAKLVDVIHTDIESFFPGLLGLPAIASGYGISQPCGHLDFYPNNGSNQPGCPGAMGRIFAGWKSLSVLDFGEVLTSCSHSRSAQYFTESINSECQFVASKCSDYKTFLRGECFTCTGKDRENCAVMGYRADTSPAWTQLKANNQNTSDLIGLKFFLTTADQSPFCHQLYRITIRLQDFSNKTVEGSINVTLYDVNETTHNIILDLSSGGLRKLECCAEMNFIVPFAASETETLLNTARVAVNSRSNHTLKVVNFAIDKMIIPNEDCDKKLRSNNAETKSIVPYATSDSGCPRNSVRVAVSLKVAAGSLNPNIAVDVKIPPNKEVKRAVFPIKLCPANHTNYAAIGKGSGAIFDVKC